MANKTLRRKSRNSKSRKSRKGGAPLGSSDNVSNCKNYWNRSNPSRCTEQNGRGARPDFINYPGALRTMRGVKPVNLKGQSLTNPNDY